MQKTTKPEDPYPFFNLPREVRNEIYGWVWANDNPKAIYQSMHMLLKAEYGDVEGTARGLTWRSLEWIMASKTFKQEALEQFNINGRLRVTFNSGHGYPPLPGALRINGDPVLSLRMIHTLHIDMILWNVGVVGIAAGVGGPDGRLRNDPLHLTNLATLMQYLAQCRTLRNLKLRQRSSQSSVHRGFDLAGLRCLRTTAERLWTLELEVRTFTHSSLNQGFENSLLHEVSLLDAHVCAGMNRFPVSKVINEELTSRYIGWTFKWTRPRGES